jgi:transposase
MNAYSKDFRLKVLEVVDRGMPRRGGDWGLWGSLTTMKRWLKRRREGEDLLSRHSTERKRRILATQEKWCALWAQLEENDDATLEGDCELREERGAKVSPRR